MTFRIMDIDYIKRRGKGQKRRGKGQKEGRGKGQKERRMRENEKKRAECLHMSKKSSTFVPKLRKYAHCVRVK